MNVVEIIRHFSEREVLPIDVENDVLPFINEGGEFEIYFFRAKFDTQIMRGKMSEWAYPDGEGTDRRVVDIEYHDGLSDAWARLVCCKELVHVCDPIDARIMTEAGLEKLINRIGLPRDMMTTDDGNAVWNDRIAIIHALAILFPWSCRQLLMAPYKDKTITLEQIAERTDLPIQYVAVVMDEEWSKFYHLIS